MPKDFQVLKQLGRLRDERADALARIDARIADQVKRGRAQGLTVTDMARRLRISRQGLYDLLARSGHQNPKPPDSGDRG